jgi:hypothetical protein
MCDKTMDSIVRSEESDIKVTLLRHGNKSLMISMVFAFSIFVEFPTEQIVT